jgi:SAM-dependent methyltransferase
MHQAIQGFDRSPDTYERGRPDYPAEAVDIIVAALGITPESAILDLAAGTGKLTRLLVPTGARIIAVEPLGGMRAKLAAIVPGIEVHTGTAEALPLEDNAVDAVTIGQAFHWFATASALREIHRVLRPGGGLALIWNQRDTKQPLQRDLSRIIESYRDGVPTHRGGDWRSAFNGVSSFTPIEEWHVPHQQVVDREGLVDRFLSISFIANLPEETRAQVRRQILDLAGDLPARIVLQYVTDIYCCRAVKDEGMAR